MGDPFVLMVAGPNGAGKTTLVQKLRRESVELGEYINPDDIARELQGSDDDRVRQAQVIADRQRQACIEARRSFTFETVMSHPSKIDILVQAKAAGFFVQLYFVGTDDPQTNIERVSLRVAQDGHGVPEEKIVARWHRSMKLLHEAIKKADQSFVYDNSAGGGFGTGPLLVFIGTRGAEGRLEPDLRINPPPIWLRQHALDPLGISSVIPPR